MHADVEQDDFLCGDPKDKDHAVAVGQAYGMFAKMLPLQGMQSQAGRVRISKHRRVFAIMT